MGYTPTLAKTKRTMRVVMTFQRRLLFICASRPSPRSLIGRRVDDRRLPLIPANGSLGHFDPHLVGDLKLNGLVAEARDLAVNPAGRDHAIANLQTIEKFLHLLLLALHRQQDDEIKDCENEGEGHQLQPR